ncbi:MAG: tetratricopeptide repeat protein [Desulfobulbaceae bacterium]|nr:tetratricopeptide repeat protein [Desulfobulbaceae bacterium]
MSFVLRRETYYSLWHEDPPDSFESIFFGNRLVDMTFTGQKTVFISRLLLVGLLFMLGGSNPSIAREAIAPERNISMIDTDLGIPDWKILWDNARSHVKSKKYSQAASVYSELYKKKSNIEQANWEYCQVLLKTGDFKNAAKIIASLLERNFHRIDYLLAGGQAATQDKDWEAAVGYYGRVLEKAPSGELSDVALEGLIGGLRNMGKKEFSLPIAEHLLVRQPDSRKLLEETALDAHTIGQNDKARQLLKKLLEKWDVEDWVLLHAAKVFDVSGEEEESSIVWQEYVKRHPDSLQFRHKLVDYHLSKAEYDAALEHLIYLIEHLEDNDAVLLKAGSINLYQLGRPDKALSYFERYFQKHPDSDKVKQYIENIQYILANDFLSIVENDGAWLLWRDLAKVTPNRVAIYRQMADLLENKGMIKECLDVLSIIHHHHPDDETISMRLAQHYFNNKQFENALSLLDKIVQKRNTTKTYYLLRANIEMELGREFEALSSYEKVLQLDSGDIEIRKISMELAGSLGNISKVKTLFEGGSKFNKRQPDKEIVFTYLDQLARNYLFREYEQVSNHYRRVYSRDKKTLGKLDLHFAVTLRLAEKTRGAEKLLRQLLKGNPSFDEVLYVLTDNALVDKNNTAAKTWFGVLEKQSTPGKFDLSNDLDGYRRILLKAKIAKAEEKYEDADQLLNDILTVAPHNQVNKDLIPLVADLEKERIWVSFYRGDYNNSLKRLEKHAERGGFDPEIFTLQRLLGRKTKQQKIEDSRNGTSLTKSNLNARQLLASIETDLKYQEYDAAERHIQAVLQNNPESVIGRVLLAKLLFAKGKFAEAAVPLRRLSELFPDEPYFHKKLVEIEMRQGNYSNGLVLLEQKDKGAKKSVETAITEFTSSDDVEESLTLARLLWGEKQHEKALQIYQRLLSPSIQELLSEKFSQKQIDYLYLTREKTIWNSLLVLLQSKPDIIAELMEPAFLVDNLANEAGKIVADYFEIYSWQKLISTEYLARKAIFEKNYTFAEQSNKRLVDEQGTPEGMIDLAAIYGRVGKYRKEAQVYEAIQNTGITSPELTKSMERSTLQLSPQNIFDAAYSAKDGRDGFVDIETVSVGTSFWFTPDLDTDIRVAYSNNKYQSINTSASTGSNLLYSTAIYEFAKDYELTFGGGVEKMDGTSNAIFLHKIALNGQLDEYFHAYMEWQKGLVHDTVMALQEGITNQVIEGGLYCETPLGLTFGGDFRHRNYSDDNTQNRFHAYSSYGLFGESVHMSLRYDYQFFKNTETNPSEISSAESQQQDILFYWSPSSFSENLITLHFQNDFLGYQQGDKRKISYYAIDNSIGFDDLETISYMGKFDIFLEMTPHFLLKGNFTFTKSDVLEEKGLSLSLHYRW